MILDELNVFGREIEATGGGTASDILDWGTSGNALGTKTGEGHHGDDISRTLSWHVQMKTDGAGPVTVKWETADKPDFTDKVELATVTTKATPVAGDKVVDGEPLPKGLKRYQRVIVKGAGGKAMAFVCDAQHA